MECKMCGTCCRIFPVPLTEEELRSGRFITEFDCEKIKYESFAEIEKNGGNILRQGSNGCVYLKDSKCSIHDRKPKHCRNFFCGDKNSSKAMREMIKQRKKET